MSDIKAKLSKKNDYYIDKERYLELKHRCRQYPFWLSEADRILMSTPEINEISGSDPSDPTVRKALRREKYLEKAAQIKRLCETACPSAPYYLLACVSAGYSYDKLEAQAGEPLPCCRVVFYQGYRKFFWLLDKEVE